MLTWSICSTSNETEVHTVLHRSPGRLIHLPRPQEMTHLVNELCMGLVTSAILLSLLSLSQKGFEQGAKKKKIHK